MSIVRCPGCARRISSLAQACPHCGYSKTGAQVDPEVLMMRQLRNLRYRARMLTYMAMLFTMLGFLMWWFQNGGFNQLPGQLSSIFIAIGVVGYLIARAWLFRINTQIKKNR